MPRLFIALNIPDLAKDALSQLQWGLDNADWHDPEGFHLTLAFLGELDPARMEDVIAVLGEIEMPAFDLTLRGVNSFGGQDPSKVWVGVDQSLTLERLQKKIVHRLRDEEFQIQRRKFVPHVTLASVRSVEVEAVHRFAASHGLFQFGPYPVDAMHVYESRRTRGGAHYEIVASFALADAAQKSAGSVNAGPVRYGV